MTDLDPSILAPRFSRFNRNSGEFEAIPNAVTFDIADITERRMPAPNLTMGKTMIAALNLYDIPQTMARALGQLEANYPDAYATVFQSPRHLGELASKGLGVKLMAVATMPADEIVRPEVWKPHFAGRALLAGCHGVVVDFEPTSIADHFPDREVWSDSHFPICS